MSLDYSLLRKLHRILKQRTDLTERIEKGPRRIIVAENAEKQIGADLDKVKETRLKVKLLADEKQLQLSSREAKIEELKGKLNSAASNKEFQLLKDQIAADEQANAVLSDEILEMLERIDVLDAELSSAKDNYSKAQSETTSVRNKVNQELDSLNQQLQSVCDELKENEGKLPGDVAAEFSRLVSRRGEDALAETDLHTCGGCYTKITTQKASELMMRQAVFCPTCGAIMYVSENQVVA